MRSVKSEDKAAAGPVVRRACPDDREALVRLWQDCFGDSDAFTRYYFDVCCRENIVLLCEYEGAVRAQLHLNPYRLSVFGRPVDSWYIVGVSTQQEYRHRGLMTLLLQKVFSMARERKMPFVYLMPADEKIYRPFQFAFVYRQPVGLLAGGGAERKSPQQICRAFSGAFPDLQIRPAKDLQDCQACADLAQAWLTGHRDIWAARDGWYYRRLQLETIADGGELLLILRGNRPAAYISYAWEDMVQIRDMLAAEDLLADISGFVRKIFAGVKTEVLSMQRLSGFDHILQRPIIMARITCLPEFARLFPAPAGSRNIRICDDWISQNNGVFQIPVPAAGTDDFPADGEGPVPVDDLVRMMLGDQRIMLDEII